MRTILILLALVASPVLAATVWKWVDASGVTHYSDTPVDGAVKVEIDGSTGNRWDSSASRAAPATSSQTATQPGKASPSYQIEIWKPASEETFANPGEAEVRLRIDPGLQTGDALYVYVDGRLLEGFSTTATDFPLQNLDRGAHSVMAVVNDIRGQQIAQSKSVQFFVRQTSVLNPTQQQPAGPPKPPKK